MKKEQIAAQLYTLRDFLKTPADIAEAMQKVKAIGYDAVQISGMGPIEESEMVKILDGEGLVCCATHEPGADIVDNIQKVIDRLNALGCKYTAYPFPHVPLNSEAAVLDLAKSLDISGKKMAEADQVLTYHNHAIEFERFGNRNALEIIYDETDPVNLQGELDTYWVQHGGCDSVVWIKRLNGRLPLLHLKEFGIIENQINILEVGSGNLDWAGIIAAGDEAGTEWFIVEQDTCRFDPFDSLKMSLDYLVENCC